jgi:hypothetical protein
MKARNCSILGSVHKGDESHIHNAKRKSSVHQKNERYPHKKEQSINEPTTYSYESD